MLCPETAKPGRSCKQAVANSDAASLLEKIFATKRDEKRIRWFRHAQCGLKRPRPNNGKSSIVTELARSGGKVKSRNAGGGKS